MVISFSLFGRLPCIRTFSLFPHGNGRRPLLSSVLLSRDLLALMGLQPARACEKRALNSPKAQTNGKRERMRGGMPIPTSYVDSKETNRCYLEHGGEGKRSMTTRSGPAPTSAWVATKCRRYLNQSNAMRNRRRSMPRGRRTRARLNSEL